MTESRNFSQTAIRLVSSVGCVLLVVLAATGLPIARMYLASALFSVLLMYLAGRPRMKDLVAIAVLGPAFVALHLWLWFGGISLPQLMLVLAGLGVATFLVLLMRAVWSDEEERRDVLQILMPAAALIVLLFLTHNLLSLAGRLTPKTLDLYTLSFDGSMGWQPSFWMGRMFREHAWLGTLGDGAYYAILIAMGASYVLYARRRPVGISRYLMLEAFFVAGTLGFVFYQMFPAAGPGYAFPGIYPFHGIPASEMSRLVVEPIVLAPNIMRNAVPSLHMTWALLIWWNLRNLGRMMGWIALVFVGLTVIGTLGTGEHYLVDLVVAFPFTLMLQGICWRQMRMRERSRWLAIVVGLAGTLLWIAGLRYGLKLFWISPVIPWAAAVVTVVGAQILVGPVSKWKTSRVGVMEESAVAAKA